MFLGDPAKVTSETASLTESIFSKARRRLTGNSPITASPEEVEVEVEGGLGVFSVRHYRVRYVKEEE